MLETQQWVNQTCVVMDTDNKYMNNWFVMHICTIVIQGTILVMKESNIWTFLHPCRAWISDVSNGYFDTIKYSQSIIVHPSQYSEELTNSYDGYRQ